VLLAFEGVEPEEDRSGVFRITPSQKELAGLSETAFKITFQSNDQRKFNQVFVC